MKTPPTISVIVPIYNVEKYLNQCLVSIVNQTYKNLQIILVDDGSTDNCPNICDEWAKRDNRIQVIHQTNQGLSAARNNGLKISVGKYVSFIDSDDWVSINLFEKTIPYFESDDVDMVVFKFAMYFSGFGCRVEKQSVLTQPEFLNSHDALDLLLEDNLLTNHVWRKIYKRELIPDNIFPKGQNFEDIFSMPELFSKCKKIVLINDVLYFYRQVTDSITHSFTTNTCYDFLKSVHHWENSLKKLVPDKILKNNLMMIDKYKFVLEKACQSGDKQLSKLIRKRLREISHKEEILYLINPKNKNQYKKFKDIGYLELLSFNRIIPLSINMNNILQFLKFQKKGAKYLLNRRKVKKEFNKINSHYKHNVYFLGASPIGNLGDQALLFATLDFSKKYFEDYHVHLIPFSKPRDIRGLRRKIKKDDFVIIKPGGSIGTLYPGIHEFFENSIKILKKANIFIFPQSFHYDNDENGKKLLAKTKQVYNSCRNLKIFTRDSYSYKFATDNFVRDKVTLEPDMALSLSVPEVNRRQGSLLLLRNDGERTLDWKTKDFIFQTVEDKFDKVTQSDMHLYHDDLSIEESHDFVMTKFKQVASSELVITDRLHGMLFAAITNTPCVAFKSKSHKTEGVYDAWLKENDFIKVIDHADDLPQAIDEVMSVKNPKLKRDKINQAFDDMAELMKKALE